MMVPVKRKNAVLLDSFVMYCLDNPDERFWQALRNWSKAEFVLTANVFDLHTRQFKGIKDTFYVE